MVGALLMHGDGAASRIKFTRIQSSKIFGFSGIHYVSKPEFLSCISLFIPGCVLAIVIELYYECTNIIKTLCIRKSKDCGIYNR